MRHYRHRAGMTQAELGARVGRSGQWIYQLERGRARASFDDLSAIARELGEALVIEPSEGK